MVNAVVMELVKEAFTAVSRYFHRLKTFGYIPDTETDKVIALFAIKDMVNNLLLNEEQYRIVEKALSCLYGSSWLLPYPEYIKQHSTVSKDVEVVYRWTEEENIRVTEDEQLRIMQ